MTSTRNEESSTMKLIVVLVGYGKWGRIYAEYLLPKAQRGQIELFVVDKFDAPDELQGEHVTFINVENDGAKLLPPTVDFVFVVCNDESHIEYMRFWRQRCNMLVVEKPFCGSLEEMIEFDKELKA